MRSFLIVFCIFSALFDQNPRDTFQEKPQKRIALVIGNGNYVPNALANPENDARSIKEVLQKLGFVVFEYENLNQSQMKRAIDEFGLKLKDYDVGLFYYAGHGIQSNGYNYLIPVDVQLITEKQVEYDCVQADRVLALMEGSGTKVNIIILDACRNNPFERSWTRSASGKGLAFMNAPSGTIIAYATSPGSTAADGSGKNGLYTSAILESIQMSDLTIIQMFQQVRNIVSQKSNNQQIPWESTSLTGDFYFITPMPNVSIKEETNVVMHSASYKSIGIIDKNEDNYRNDLLQKQRKAEALFSAHAKKYTSNVNDYQGKADKGLISKDSVQLIEESLFLEQQKLLNLRDSLQDALLKDEDIMNRLLYGTPRDFFMYSIWRDFNNDGIGNRDEYININQATYVLTGLKSLGFSFYGGYESKYKGVNLTLTIQCLEDNKMIYSYNEKYNGTEIQNFNCESKYFMKNGKYKATLSAGNIKSFTLEFKIVK